MRDSEPPLGRGTVQPSSREARAAVTDDDPHLPALILDQDPRPRAESGVAARIIQRGGDGAANRVHGRPRKRNRRGRARHRHRVPGLEFQHVPQVANMSSSPITAGRATSTKSLIRVIICWPPTG